MIGWQLWYIWEVNQYCLSFVVVYEIVCMCVCYLVAYLEIRREEGARGGYILAFQVYIFKSVQILP